MSSLKPKLTFTLFIFISLGAISQKNPQKSVYEAYDAIVSLDNTGLYNGTEFNDPFLNTDGTYRYFNGFDYTKGSLEYKGRQFAGVSLKYDLLDDNLLTRSNDNLNIFNVKLIPEFVNSFSIYNHNFVRLENTNLNIEGNGFFEVGHLGKEVSLYIKRGKKKKDKPLKSSIQYKFTEITSYVLKFNGSYNVVGNAKDVRKILPEMEEQIRMFAKTHKTLSKSNQDSFMIKLTQNLDTSSINAKQ